MRLTNLLFRRNRMPNGNIFTGKDRVVRIVKPEYVKSLKRDYETEERNMLFLRYPYLTEEESFGHAKALGAREAYKAKWQNETRSQFKPDVTLSERLNHLNVKNAWD